MKNPAFSVFNFFTLGALKNITRKRRSHIRETISDVKQSSSRTDFQSINDVPIDEIEKRYKRLRLSSFMFLVFIVYSICFSVYSFIVPDEFFGSMRPVYALSVLLITSVQYFKLLFIAFVTRTNIAAKLTGNEYTKITISNFVADLKQTKQLIMPKLNCEVEHA